MSSTNGEIRAKKECQATLAKRPRLVRQEAFYATWPQGYSKSTRKACDTELDVYEEEGHDGGDQPEADTGRTEFRRADGVDVQLPFVVPYRPREGRQGC